MLKNCMKIIILSLVTLSLSMETALAFDIKKIKEDIYNHLENWDTQFEISYCESDIINIIHDSALKDDYLSRSLAKIKVEGNGKTAKVNVVYRTNKEQEEFVDRKIKESISEIIDENMSDYDKVKAINKYLINQFDYDETLKSNNAYSALMTGKTTCQGYAMTAYKMFNEAGINNKIVLGDVKGIPHVWNKVEISGVWYNIDITNNDSVGSNMFFLKSDAYFIGKGFRMESNQDFEPCLGNY